MQTYIETLQTLSLSSISFCQVTLVAKRGSVPQEIGAKMIVTSDSLNSPYFGTIGGGRVELRAIEISKEMIKNSNCGELITINLDRDLGMVCGGEVTLFFEATSLSKWNIAIFGAGHVAQALISILINLDCQIFCLDERQEWINRLPKNPKVHATLVTNLESDIKNLPENSFALSLTHGHIHDHRYIKTLLQTFTPPYLGAIGSHKKANELKAQLIKDGFNKETVSKIHSPIGVKVGGNSPYEVALSIATELLQCRDQFKLNRED